jgi:hypothetical protein
VGETPSDLLHFLTPDQPLFILETFLVIQTTVQNDDSPFDDERADDGQSAADEEETTA